LAVISFAYKILRRFLPEEKVEAVKGLTITADGSGVVFDVPAEHLDAYLAGREFCLLKSMVILVIYLTQAYLFYR
jgi:ATP-dependent RNA helicase DDX21